MVDEGMDPLSRRALLRKAALGAVSFAGGQLAWAPAARAGDAGEAAVRPGPAVIVLWLRGGPSQLETFDPHPGGPIGGPTRAIATSLEGVQVAAGFPRVAERMRRLSMIRSLVTTEGEHQRGTYLLRTGQQLLPTATYPALTAVAANDLTPEGLVIPPHVAVLDRDPPRGGFLGARLNAFAIGDPKDPIEDLAPPSGLARLDARLAALGALEAGFAAGRQGRCRALQHGDLAGRARALMASPQVKAFSLDDEPRAARAAYGDTPFGRGCLVARRLVEAGVPAVEVTLDGWDSHVDNFTIQARLAEVLDAALAALLDDLAQRDLHSRVLLVVGGEFGRTPTINRLDGRDHWTRGFPMLLAGRGIRPGVVLGSTDPAGERPPEDPVSVPDAFATLYRALGVDTTREFYTPAGRPVKINEGTPLAKLLV
jgi:hypothetical protein